MSNNNLTVTHHLYTNQHLIRTWETLALIIKKKQKQISLNIKQRLVKK